MWDEIRERLVESFRGDAAVAGRWDRVVADVRDGRLSPATAAQDLLAAHGLADVESDDPGGER